MSTPADFMGTSIQAASLASERIKSDIITQTLDKLNAPMGGSAKNNGMSQTYEFSKDVLSGAYAGKGAIVDSGDSGGDLITQTLDKLNAPMGGSSNNSGMSQTYEFSKDVLSGAYLGKGAIFSSDF